MMEEDQKKVFGIPEESETINEVEQNDSFITPTITNSIPKKVRIRQFRRNGWLPPGHDGEYRFSYTSDILTVQRDRRTGLLNTGLTKEEEKALEAEMRLPKGSLSRHNADWWAKFTIAIPQGGLTLDIENDPMDFIRWKVALVHQEFANSEADKANSPFATYVLTSEEEQSAETNKVIDGKIESYKFFTAMTESDMKDFLLVYGKSAGEDAKVEFVKAEIGRIIENDHERFLNILKDESYKKRLFINKCISKGVLRNSGSKYLLHGGDVIGYSLQQAIDYLGNPENQEVYLTLKTQLEESK